MTSILFAFINRYMYWLTIDKVHVTDVVEIIIIAFVVYEILLWIKSTRAWQLFRGIVVILIFICIAAIFQMNTILWLAGKLASIVVIALVVIFHPELRRALAQLGRRNIFAELFRFRGGKNERFSKENIREITKAAYDMGAERTGALIVLERDICLDEYIRSGIPIDSLISSQLICNIFEHNTPLHDGAVIIREDRILAATCYLPLSDNTSLSKDLGTRHRAAVGISELSDSLTIVVSEESGGVSLAVDGVLHRDVDREFFASQIKRASAMYAHTEPYFKTVKRRLK